MEKLNIIGRTTLVSLPSERLKGLPAKIDTGADTSSIWASDISISPEGVLSYRLFAPGAKFYSGKLHQTTDFEASYVRSSNGAAQIRYTVRMPIVIDGRRIRARFTLADRSKNTYAVLVGCRALRGKFLVNPAVGGRRLQEAKLSAQLTASLRKDPYQFYTKYHKNNIRGDVQS